MRCLPDIVYDPENGLSLDMYLPGEADPSACILFLHDGDFRSGRRDDEDAQILAAQLTDAGFAFASISYRLHTGPEAFDEALRPEIEHYINRTKGRGLMMPSHMCGFEMIAALEDLSKAVEFIWVSAERFDLQTRNVGVVGVGAGGIVALSSAFEPVHWIGRISRPDAVVGVGAALVQPWRLNTNAPPCLMINGPDDEMIAQVTVDFILQRASEVGAPVTGIDTATSGHEAQVTAALSVHDASGVPIWNRVLAHFDQLRLG